jgi:hypothetical protein
MPSEGDRKRQAFYALIERYNQLGAMLPEPGQMDGADVEAVKLVLKERWKRPRPRLMQCSTGLRHEVVSPACFVDRRSNVFVTQAARPLPIEKRSAFLERVPGTLSRPDAKHYRHPDDQDVQDAVAAALPWPDWDRVSARGGIGACRLGLTCVAWASALTRPLT